MKPTPIAEPLPGRALRGAGVWLLLALACSALAWCDVFSWYPGRVGIAFRRAFTWELLRWNLWLPMAAWIFRWHRRFGSRRHAAGRDLATVLLFPALHTILLLAVNWVLSPAGITAFVRHRAYALIPNYLTGIIICALTLGLARARAEESRASRLEAQLSQAQLDALKMQLQPHFLFNTLNAISALQLQDPEAAQRMIVRLSDFLRMTLENAALQEVSLDREIDFLARYLEIERVRFQRRLAVEIAIEPEVRCALVPNLILQPIVENAIRHGISAQACSGTVGIHARRRNGSLLLAVRDTGPGTRGAAVLEGRGLSITRARLERMYGRDSRLSAGNAAGTGFEVAIEIPFVPGAGL